MWQHHIDYDLMCIGTLKCQTKSASIFFGLDQCRRFLLLFIA